MIDYLVLTTTQRATLHQHAVDAAPDEACGLLIGHQQRVTQVLPMDNVADRPHTAFALGSLDLLRELQRIESEGLSLLGIYHSHPRGRALPSPTDIHAARLNYPHIAHIVVGLQPPQMSAWRIDAQGVQPIALPPTPPAGPSNNGQLSRAQTISIVLVATLALLAMVALSFALLPPAPIITTPAT